MNPRGGIARVRKTEFGWSLYDYSGRSITVSDEWMSDRFDIEADRVTAKSGYKFQDLPENIVDEKTTAGSKTQ